MVLQQLWLLASCWRHKEDKAMRILTFIVLLCVIAFGALGYSVVERVTAAPDIYAQLPLFDLLLDAFIVHQRLWFLSIAVCLAVILTILISWRRSI